MVPFSKSLPCGFPPECHRSAQAWALGNSAASAGSRGRRRVVSPGLSDTWPQHLLPQKYQKADLAFTQDMHNRGFELLCGHSWLQSWIPTSTVLTTAYAVLSSHVLQFILKSFGSSDDLQEAFLLDLCCPYTHLPFSKSHGYLCPLTANLPRLSLSAFPPRYFQLLSATNTFTSIWERAGNADVDCTELSLTLEDGVLNDPRHAQGAPCPSTSSCSPAAFTSRSSLQCFHGEIAARCLEALGKS